jgi:hypothetical protein
MNDMDEYNLTELFNDMESALIVLNNNKQGVETIRDVELTKIDLKQCQQLLFEIYKTARIIH